VALSVVLEDTITGLLLCVCGTQCCSGGHDH